MSTVAYVTENTSKITTKPSRQAIKRAALAWTEAVTLISETRAPDDAYNGARAHFSETEMVNLTMLIAAINSWNRLAIAFRSIPPVRAKAAA